MKEDILEQLVDDYLKFNGYFTAHNVKFQPAQTHPEYVKKDDCVASDIDVIGFHPRREGPDRVWIVSCDLILNIESLRLKETRESQDGKLGNHFGNWLRQSGLMA